MSSWGRWFCFNAMQDSLRCSFGWRQNGWGRFIVRPRLAMLCSLANWMASSSCFLKPEDLWCRPYRNADAAIVATHNTGTTAAAAVTAIADEVRPWRQNTIGSIDVCAIESDPIATTTFITATAEATKAIAITISSRTNTAFLACRRWGERDGVGGHSRPLLSMDRRYFRVAPKDWLCFGVC